jgi:hypothetical protein
VFYSSDRRVKRTAGEWSPALTWLEDAEQRDLLDSLDAA